jgi:hypothetical protein
MFEKASQLSRLTEIPVAVRHTPAMLTLELRIVNQHLIPFPIAQMKTL